MSNYRKVKISEIAEVIGGGTPSTRIPEYWEGNIPWLTPKDLTNYSKTQICNGERNITELGLSKSSARLLDEGAVLLTSRAPIGYVAIAGKALATNQGFKSLIVKPKVASNYYLYYWLKGNTEYLNSLGTGTTFAEISGGVIKDIEIPLPPLPEQQAIAEVLSSLDDKIDLLIRNNKTLEEIADSLFNEKYSADSRQATLKLKEIVETSGGYNHDLSELSDDGEILLSMGSISKKYGLNLDRCRYIKKPNADSKILAVTGDIIISTRDITQDADLLGSPGIISKRIKKRIIVGSNLYKLKITRKEIETIWLYFLLRSKSYREYVKEVASGTSILMLKKEDLLNFTFYPPASNGSKLISALTHVCNKIEANNEQIQMLNETRNTLLPKLMSGQVRVNI